MALKRKQEELARLTNEINMFESEKVTRELILLNAHEIDTKLGEIAKLTTKYYNENSKKQLKQLIKDTITINDTTLNAIPTRNMPDKDKNNLKYLIKVLIANKINIEDNINRVISPLSLGVDSVESLDQIKIKIINNIKSYVNDIKDSTLTPIVDVTPIPIRLNENLSNVIYNMLNRQINYSNQLDKVQKDIILLESEIVEIMRKLRNRHETVRIPSSIKQSNINKSIRRLNSTIGTSSIKQSTNKNSTINITHVVQMIHGIYPVYDLNSEKAISMAKTHPDKYILRVASDRAKQVNPSAKYVATRFTKDDSPISHQIIKTIPNNGTIVDIHERPIPYDKIYTGTSGGRFSARKTRKTNRTRKSVKK